MMSNNPPFNYRFLYLTAVIFLFGLLVACTNSDPEENSFDFGNENQFFSRTVRLLSNYFTLVCFRHTRITV